MLVPAGRYYEVSIKSGGPLRGITSGGVIGLPTLGKDGPLANRRRVFEPSGEGRALALRSGRVMIKEVATGKTVWSRPCSKIRNGDTPGSFIERIDSELEELDLFEFRAKWNIEAALPFEPSRYRGIG